MHVIRGSRKRERHPECGRAQLAMRLARAAVSWPRVHVKRKSLHAQRCGTHMCAAQCMLRSAVKHVQALVSFQFIKVKLG